MFIYYLLEQYTADISNVFVITAKMRIRLILFHFKIQGQEVLTSGLKPNALHMFAEQL